MGTLLSGGAKTESDDFQSSRIALPQDIQLTGRVLQDVEHLIGEHPHRAGTPVKLAARIYWVDTFGILYTEWHVLGLSSQEHSVMSGKTSMIEKKMVHLVSNVSQAGSQATFIMDDLFNVVDKAINDILPHLKKLHMWEEVVRNSVKS